LAQVHILDTSAFSRAFGETQDRDWVVSLMQARRAYMCLLGLTEARSIVSTRLRRGLDESSAARLWSEIQVSLKRVRFTDLLREDFEVAQEIMTGDAGLRASDALHVAAARRLAQAGVGVTFVTADARQAKAAASLVDEVRLLA
jgi:predicted nucleic acid-binding protein